MSVSNNKISAPIGLQEVYSLLGVSKTGTYYDVAYICGNAHGRINKWSKKKPIRYAQAAALTDAQFRGTTADNINGIYYGLQTQTTAGRFDELHTISWTYLPPRPGTDWCRLTDFNGYDHAATPTLNGAYTGGSPVYYNLDRQLTVNITYNSNNTTGVDIADMLPTNTDQNIGDYYPCILVGNYARVMFNTTLSEGSTSGGTYTTLYHNNVWYTRFYAELKDLPSVKAGTYQCTVFLIRDVFAGGGVLDLRNWVNVANTINAYNAFSVPGLINMSLPFQEYAIHYPTVTITKVTATSGSNVWPNANSGFSLGYSKDFTTGTHKFIVGIASPGPVTKTYTITGSGLVTLINFTWKETGIIPAPGTSRPSRVAGTVYYVDENNRQHVVSDFDLPVS